MRNVKTREGMEYWDKICSLKHYGFIHSPDNSRVLKAEGIGNWIDKFEAQAIVDQAQDEINQFRAERDALQLLLNQRDEQIDTLKLQPQAASAVATLDYGSLDAAQRLALCRGEQPAPVATVLPER